METAGKISALCFIGAEKVFYARSFSPSAIATEPFRPEVSTASIKGFCAERLWGQCSECFSNVCVRVCELDVFLLIIPCSICRLVNYRTQIVYHREGINQIFLLQNDVFVCRLIVADPEGTD